MPAITSETIPRVEVDFMNEDHLEAVELIGRVQRAIKAIDMIKISAALETLYQHNVEHFAREEEQMLRLRFPPYACHKDEHERVLAELQQVINQWQQGQDCELLGHYLDDSLSSWLVDHINTMDRVTARFISFAHAER